MPTPRALPKSDPSLTAAPSPAGGNEPFKAIARRVEPTPKRLTIMSALATGHLPWGVPWSRDIVRFENRWVLCCGHAMEFDEAAAFVSAGLLQEAQREDGRPCLTLTEAGACWLATNWPS